VKLSHCAYECLKAFFQATLRKKHAVIGVILAIQTSGDLVNFHPHLHAIISEGPFAAKGCFYFLPKIDPRKLKVMFRHQVLKMLLRV
jgi:Putative transposase